MRDRTVLLGAMSAPALVVSSREKVGAAHFCHHKLFVGRPSRSCSRQAGGRRQTPLSCAASTSTTARASAFQSPSPDPRDAQLHPPAPQLCPTLPPSPLRPSRAPPAH